MFDFLKRKKDKPLDSTAPLSKQDAVVVPEAASLPGNPPEKVGVFTRLKQGLQKTRKQFNSGLATLLLGKKQIDAELLADLEEMLLSADVGLAATEGIIENLTDQVTRKQLQDPEALYTALKQALAAIIAPCAKSLVIDASTKPYVILVVGVNGVGKTTTIGKLAKRYKAAGHKVMLAAGDTFRAAAVDQLEIWGQRNQIPVVAQSKGADSASVIYDAMQAAAARDIDILIADTAGRLHTQANLMAELAKVKRVIQKFAPGAPQEVLLVLDATTGQNALKQARQFSEAVAVSGLALTKLDGTAKGGIIFAIAQQFKLPIRFIGIGEQIDDLRDFDADEFVAALLAEDERVQSEET